MFKCAYVNPIYLCLKSNFTSYIILINAIIFQCSNLSQVRFIKGTDISVNVYVFFICLFSLISSLILSAFNALVFIKY